MVTKPAPSPAASRPEDCDRLFAEAVNVGNLAAVLALYEEDGCFVQRDGVAAGHSAIRTVVAEMLTKDPRLTCRVWKVVRCGEDLALLYNDWSLSMKGPDGGRVDRSGKALELVRRQADGTWRFAIDDPYGRG